MLKPGVLTGRRNFETVYKRGKSMGSPFVVLFYMRNGLALTRTGFLASKKVGNAVCRNRAKRLMKESVRLMDPLPTGYDIIFIARTTINGKKLDQVSGSIVSALKRANIV